MQKLVGEVRWQLLLVEAEPVARERQALVLPAEALAFQTPKDGPKGSSTLPPIVAARVTLTNLDQDEQIVLALTSGPVRQSKLVLRQIYEKFKLTAGGAQ